MISIIRIFYSSSIALVGHTPVRNDTYIYIHALYAKFIRIFDLFLQFLFAHQYLSDTICKQTARHNGIILYANGILIDFSNN